MKTGSWINNQNQVSPTSKAVSVINPATALPCQEIFPASVAAVDVAVNGADEAFQDSWRDMTPGKRTEILFRISKAIRDEASKLAAIETQNCGKPISDSRDEIALGSRIFEYYAGAITKFYGQTIPVSRGGFDFTIRQSLGVVAAIVPWNFPFPIACWKIAPALAAGNTVILKPAELTPLTALALGRICAEAGLPPGVLQILPGSGGEIGEALVQHPQVRKISFTGSTTVGSRIMSLASRDIKRVSLELGGKSPNIIFADANLAEAAKTSPMSVFANAGQDCCARSRVFVEESVLEKFLELFVQESCSIVVGNPEEEKTQVGPLISANQRAKVERFVQEIDSKRCKVLCGGDRLESNGFFLRPTVITGAEVSDSIWKEEIFGPVVTIRSFKDEKKMLQEVNASPYGLSGSIWTNNLKRALRVARQVESGVLSINSHSSVHVEAPFGGFKMSGIGRDLGMSAMEGYTELKNIYVAD